ncbi:hypothetical protein DVH05_010248 [Phytophthora capsici]|nr:hypothetical protein DVH05_002965 [Phytophthora capsici]KAG1701754.1 hypothetical protein DVH05_010248 [Phytophthora capsici]
MVKLYYAIVEVGGTSPGSGFEVDIDNDASVAALKKVIKKENKNKLKSVDAGELQLFLAKKDGAWLQSEDILRMWEKKIPERDYMIEELKDPVTKIRAIISSELPDGSIHVLVVVPMEDSERRWEELLSSLAWENPERLCGSSGCDWAYQGASELVETLKDPLVTHYKAWQVGNKDKRNHPLHLVLSGPGTGKSRMLDEMKNLLCAAAIESKDQALVGRMKSAYMFRVTFENGTQATGSLLNRDIPEYDISYRMLYQLSTGEKPWGDFVHSLKMYPQKHISIERVISILAKREGVDVKNMTVILCVDGLQMLVSDGTKTCDFNRVMSSICGFLNSSTAFAVCVCSATIEKPVRKALVDSSQNRLYLVPPVLCGEKVLETRTPTKKLLVGDMDGHGRALETLDSVCRKLKVGEEEINPGYVVDKVKAELQLVYPGLFDRRVFKPDTCKELVSAIISKRQYDVTDIIGKTSLTVDELRSFGLFRLTSEGRLECVFIFFVELIRMMPKLKGEMTNFDNHITRSVTTWQPFEYPVGFYRQVKSIAFRDTPLPLSKFHAGARFGKIDGVMITEPSPRELVQALHQHGTKSSSGVSVVTTDQHDDVMVSDMKTIIPQNLSDIVPT